MYRVRWHRRALDELANLWLQADSELREAITRASQLIDLRLRRRAPDEGESRSHGQRIAFMPPLAVIFRVEADAQTVSVLQIRLLRHRRQ